MDFSVVLAASAAVNRLIEAVKPFVRKWNISTEVQDGVLVILQVLAGIAVALMGNLSLFTAVPQIPTFAGLLLTGAIIGLGADFIHIIIDFLYSWRDNARPVDGVILPAAESVEVTTTAKVG